ncbi:hypothetical protein NXS19_005128 [Fusarium pseudograminearum]|nr:hypothetical protein NXS19_005128 [Fusarium pseudograminearum]
MCFRKSLNPNRKSKRELDRQLLYADLHGYVTTTKTSRKKAERERKRAERERNSGNSRPHRPTTQPHTAQISRNSSTASTKPLARTSVPYLSGDSAIYTARPDQSLVVNHNMVRPGSFTVTRESSASQFNSQDPNSTFTTEATDIGIYSVDERDLMIEPTPAAYHTAPNTLSQFEDLDFSSSHDLWNTFEPQDMSPDELYRHMEETAREIQRRAPPPPWTQALIRKATLPG